MANYSFNTAVQQVYGMLMINCLLQKAANYKQKVKPLMGRASVSLSTSVGFIEKP
jgi:hypothetical protein